MVKYLLKRLAILLVTLWVVITLSFFLMQVLPGTPYNNPKLTDQMIAMMNKQYGLERFLKILIQSFCYGVSCVLRCLVMLIICA